MTYVILPPDGSSAPQFPKKCKETNAAAEIIMAWFHKLEKGAYKPRVRRRSHANVKQAM